MTRLQTWAVTLGIALVLLGLVMAHEWTHGFSDVRAYELGLNWSPNRLQVDTLIMRLMPDSLTCGQWYWLDSILQSRGLP